jgi:lysozyme
MTTEDDVLLLASKLVEKHEGYSEFPKPDSNGTVQIGYGTNLTRRGIGRVEAWLLMHRDVVAHSEALAKYPWWSGLSEARQAVLIDMAYALGDHGLSGFVALFTDVAAGNFELAGDAILSSRFALEDRTRAADNARIMRDGKL